MAIRFHLYVNEEDLLESNEGIPDPLASGVAMVIALSEAGWDVKSWSWEEVDWSWQGEVKNKG